MITRFSVIPDERKIMLGVDNAGIFEPGTVYEAVKILDQIVIRPLGKYSLPENGNSFPNKNSEVGAIIYDGKHLITEEEYTRYFR